MGYRDILSFLVGGFSPPLWKIWVRQLGWWHSQLNGKIKNVPNHQPAIIYIPPCLSKTPNKSKSWWSYHSPTLTRMKTYNSYGTIWNQTKSNVGKTMPLIFTTLLTGEYSLFLPIKKIWWFFHRGMVPRFQGPWRRVRWWVPTWRSLDPAEDFLSNSMACQMGNFLETHQGEVDRELHFCGVIIGREKR